MYDGQETTLSNRKIAQNYIHEMIFPLEFLLFFQELSKKQKFHGLSISSKGPVRLKPNKTRTLAEIILSVLPLPQI